MSSTLIAAALCAVPCASLVLGAFAPQEPDSTGLAATGTGSTELIGGIAWERDLGAARLRAALEEKPLLIVVRCPP